MTDALRDHHGILAALRKLLPFCKPKATAAPSLRPRSYSAPANVLLNVAPPTHRVAPLSSLPPVSLGPTFDEDGFNVAALARPVGPQIPAIDRNDRSVDHMFNQLELDLEQAVDRRRERDTRRVRPSNGKDLARQRLSMPLLIRPTSAAEDGAVEPVRPASGLTGLEFDKFANCNSNFHEYQHHIQEALRLVEQGHAEHLAAYFNVALDAMQTALEQGGATNAAAVSDSNTANGARSQAQIHPPRLEISTASLAVSASQQTQSPTVATASRAAPSSELRRVSSSMYSASINGTRTDAKIPSLHRLSSTTSEDLDSPPKTPRASAASTRVNILSSPPPVPARNPPTAHAASILPTRSVEPSQNNDPPREDSAAVIDYEAKNKTSPKANGTFPMI